MSSAVSKRPPPKAASDRRPEASVWARIGSSAWTYRLLTLCVFCAAWEVFARLTGSFLIPTFSGTVVSLTQLLTDPAVYKAFLISNEAFAAGFGVSLLGIPTGLAMARFAIADRVVDPYLNILLVAPTAVLIPILIIAVGLGLGSRVIIVVIFTIPLVVVNCHTAVRQIDPSLIEMAHSFGASERQIWQRILLPGALPGIMTGVRVGLGRAIQGMVIVELLMVAAGIGGLIQQYKGFFAAESLYAMVILIIFEALIVVNLARLFERRMAAWAQPARLSE